MRSFALKDLLADVSRDVLPDDVAPETTTLTRCSTRWRMIAVHDSGPKEARGRMRRVNLRMEIVAPRTATGGITTHAREPSVRRVSRTGDRRSSRRPEARMMRSMHRDTSDEERLPTCRRPSGSSTHSCSPSSTMISEISGLSRCSCSGPSSSGEHRKVDVIGWGSSQQTIVERVLGKHPRRQLVK